jgi:hypothetical protein
VNVTVPGMMLRQRDQQITVRLPAELLCELNAEAAAADRPLAALIRQILIDHAAQRVLERGVVTASQGRAC